MSYRVRKVDDRSSRRACCNADVQRGTPHLPRSWETAFHGGQGFRRAFLSFQDLRCALILSCGEPMPDCKIAVHFYPTEKIGDAITKIGHPPFGAPYPSITWTSIVTLRRFPVISRSIDGIRGARSAQ